MRNIIDRLDLWLADGKEIALATVTETWGSSPRPVGAVMAFTADGDMAGSVSGGCIEGAVAQAAVECLRENKCVRMPFKASHQAAWDVGLSCGGSIGVIVRPLDIPCYFTERMALSADRPYMRLVLTLGPDPALIGTVVLVDNNGIFFSPFASEINDSISEQLESIPQSAVCGSVEVPLHGRYPGLSFSFSRQRTRPQLICVGGTHVAIFLTQLAHPLGYSTTVIDPRGIFATHERFPHVDVLTHAWPQQAFADLNVTQETAICVLTHDPKIDLPALELALATPAFYIGSLGRSSTQRQRYNALIKQGVTPRDIERIYGPIGLDLGGRSPEEIALAIFAEVTAVRYGRDAASRHMSEFVTDMLSVDRTGSSK
jgi:xanthine dehydrogenase accessory factor